MIFKSNMAILTIILCFLAFLMLLPYFKGILIKFLEKSSIFLLLYN